MRLRWVVIALAVVAVIGFAWWVSDLQRRADTAIAERDTARGELAAAQLRGRTQARATETAGALGVTERTIHEEVSRATETVREAIGPDESVDGVLRAWAAGIDGLRADGMREPAAGEGAAGAGDTGLGLFTVRAERAAEPAAAGCAGFCEA